MSRRSRQRANARPWEQLRDADEGDIDRLLSESSQDEHSREAAWQQREHEQQQERPER